MIENNRNNESALAENEELRNVEDTTPKEEPEATIPVKFNKEIKNLTVDEAAKLAQKGMKYDLIFNDYETLKNLSRKNGKSVTEFVEGLKADDYDKRLKELTEKCGGDEALAEHIVKLESENASDTANGFGELQNNFPEIKSLEELPEEIVEAAKLKGTLLLDEYLRYLLKQKRYSEEMKKTGKLSENASVGSQLNRRGKISPEASEFLKGLWK